jgi:hypothetical protein
VLNPKEFLSIISRSIEGERATKKYRGWLTALWTLLTYASLGTILGFYIKSELAPLRDWHYILPLSLSFLAFLALFICFYKFDVWINLFVASLLASAMFLLSGAILRASFINSDLYKGIILRVDDISDTYYVIGIILFSVAIIGILASYLYVSKRILSTDGQDKNG